MSRGRALASLTTVLGLGLAAAAVASTPGPVGRARRRLRPAVPGAALARATPSPASRSPTGTTPEGFTGEVIGVLEDGIAPGRRHGHGRGCPRPRSTGSAGIWQGMSGSPVYAADGRLIGAVAYGLSCGPSPVAGVTPFADMDDYLAAAGARAHGRGSATAPRAPSRAETERDARPRPPRASASCAMPLGVSGVSGNRLAAPSRPPCARSTPWLPASTYTMGAAAAAGAGPGADTIVAGGNLAASLSYGDVTRPASAPRPRSATASVVGFGHPMTFLGDDARWPCTRRTRSTSRRSRSARRSRWRTSARPSAPSPTTT